MHENKGKAGQDTLWISRLQDIPALASQAIQSLIVFFTLCEQA